MNALRLFFALLPAPDVGAAIVSTAAPLVASLDAQPAPASNLHATLCFIGPVPAERLEALCVAAASVRGARVELEFDAFEFWDKPRLLCATASRESPQANALAVALQEVAASAEFTPDVKPFRAHLTLARKIAPSKAAHLGWPLKISPGFVVCCDRFALMESRRGEAGSIYSVVDEWPLYE